MLRFLLLNMSMACHKVNTLAGACCIISPGVFLAQCVEYNCVVAGKPFFEMIAATF